MQTATLASMGAVYWFVAALVVRWTAANWVGSDGATALVFALIVVATVPALFLGMAVARVGRDRAQISATVMTGTALLLDGVALTWAKSLYGTDPSVVLGGAASIMWGAGVALALGMMLERR
ncbi:hypothetical protein [Sphingomonas sp. SUN039]|uniref:hypothetical protein n=1 Tax=Sphingomonas sp. SUN039 TaxID=2937787 RepID=UPI0021647AC4|nr:hypothetical protein [Sphingomonas sp. SUN039]UVO54692.1 hypothetical protein M0209_11375 [Sphingomonas sp. SUN039]